MGREILIIPDDLPAPAAELAVSVPELALELYRRVADSAREAEEHQKKARQEIDRSTQEAGRTLARVAAARFELGRLLARVLPMLVEADRGDVARILELFTRGWDAELERARVEVRDVTGQALTDELAAVIEVEGAIPDPGVDQAMVRETLSPLVLWAGRIVGVARVITSVPLAIPFYGAKDREPALRAEEES
jgi:hypothetical protein